MEKYNLRNPAVKRIVQELKEVQRDDNPDIVAEANEDNIFEWNFAIRGAWDTEFEGGIYHGRIIMPAEYPFKPPAFMMLSQSGRFETNVKICLSISSHHPESWQPSWSVRSALVALIAFMQSPGHGALGSLDHSKDVRRQLAAAAREKPPQCGNQDRQKVINGLHHRMLQMEGRSRQLSHPSATSAPQDADSAPNPASGDGAASGVQRCEGGVGTPDGSGDGMGKGAEGGGEAASSAQRDQQDSAAADSVQAAASAKDAGAGVAGAAAADVGEAQLRQRRGGVGLGPAAAGAAQGEEGVSCPAGDAAPLAAAAPQLPHAAPRQGLAVAAAAPAGVGSVQRHAQQATAYEDRLLTWLAALLVAGILALVCRRLFGAAMGIWIGEGVPRSGHEAFGDSQL